MPRSKSKKVSRGKPNKKGKTEESGDFPSEHKYPEKYDPKTGLLKKEYLTKKMLGKAIYDYSGFKYIVSEDFDGQLNWLREDSVVQRRINYLEFAKKHFKKPLKVTIVGAGPVGLYTAILFKYYLGDKVNVTVYEKYYEHTRDQTLLINKFILIPEVDEYISKNPNICFLAHSPLFDLTGDCLTKSDYYNRLASMHIRDLQEVFQEIVKKQGTQILHRTFDPKKDTNYDILIGSDGLSSTVRQDLMKIKTKKVKGYHSYTIILTYFDENSQKHIKSTPNKNDVRARFSQVRRRFFRNRDGSSYLTIQIPKKDYMANEKAEKYQDLTKNLKEVVKENLKMMDSKPKNLNSVAVKMVPVHLEYTDLVAKRLKKKLVFLVGDATGNVHFFTGSGANTGFSQANDLLDTLYDTKFGQKKMISYNRTNLDLITFLNLRHQDDWSRNKLLVSERSHLNFKIVGQICQNMSKEEFEELVKESRIPNASKEEQCFLLSTRLLDRYTYLYE